MIEIRTDPSITDASSPPATIDEIRDLQNVSADDYTGSGVDVVVMDSGIDDSHPVFDGRDVRHVDPAGIGTEDRVGHGTAVAGTITRLAPDAALYSLPIFADSGKTDWETIKSAYNWLINNGSDKTVVNMSWGSRRKVQRIDETHNDLVDTGVHTVVAAGNTSDRGGSPATADRAFSTAAVTTAGTMTNFSSYNPDWDNPDVAAVGKNNRLPRADGTNMGTVIDGDWVMASGTSFAAPIVTALYARLVEARDRQLHSYGSLFETRAQDIPDTVEDGHGIADYSATLDALTDGKRPREPDHPTTPDPWWVEMLRRLVRHF